MNITNQAKKDEREKELYIIVEKNLEKIKDIAKIGHSENRLILKDEIQPKVLFENHDKDITKYMLATLYKSDKYKLRYIMKAHKI